MRCRSSEFVVRVVLAQIGCLRVGSFLIPTAGRFQVTERPRSTVRNEGYAVIGCECNESAASHTWSGNLVSLFEVAPRTQDSDVVCRT
jgi:hypothetical protein